MVVGFLLSSHYSELKLPFILQYQTTPLFFFINELHCILTPLSMLTLMIMGKDLGADWRLKMD